MKFAITCLKTAIDLGRLAKAFILWMMLLAGLILVTKHSTAFGEMLESTGLWVKVEK